MARFGRLYREYGVVPTWKRVRRDGQGVTAEPPIDVGAGTLLVRGEFTRQYWLLPHDEALSAAVRRSTRDARIEPLDRLSVGD